MAILTESPRQWGKISMKQYEEMGVQRTCGGIELAQNEESMEELKRRMCAAKNWGIESELLDPDGVRKLFPWVNKDKILGGFHIPSVSVVNSLRAGTFQGEKAQAMGALSVFAHWGYNVTASPNA